MISLAILITLSKQVYHAQIKHTWISIRKASLVELGGYFSRSRCILSGDKSGWTAYPQAGFLLGLNIPLNSVGILLLSNECISFLQKNIPKDSFFVLMMYCEGMNCQLLSWGSCFLRLFDQCELSDCNEVSRNACIVYLLQKNIAHYLILDSLMGCGLLDFP